MQLHKTAAGTHLIATEHEVSLINLAARQLDATHFGTRRGTFEGVPIYRPGTCPCEQP